MRRVRDVKMPEKTAGWGKEEKIGENQHFFYRKTGDIMQEAQKKISELVDISAVCVVEFMKSL